MDLAQMRIKLPPDWGKRSITLLLRETTGMKTTTFAAALAVLVAPAAGAQAQPLFGDASSDARGG